MYILQNQTQFLNDFLSRVKNAKKRVWVQAMIVESGQVLDQFIAQLKNNTNLNSLDIQIQYDWITNKSVHGETPLLPVLSKDEREYARKLHIRNYLMFKKLRGLNATVTLLNAPKVFPHILPITGRNHTKIYIIDDTAWIGGCNFMDKSFTKFDFMLCSNDPQYVNTLAQHFKLVNKNKPKTNTRIELNNQDIFLADNGKRGKSIIYKEALNLINQSIKEIIFISQFTPTGKILESMLEKSKQGVTVRVVTSPSDHIHFNKLPHTIPHNIFIQKTKNLTKFHLHHIKKPVHAKIILTDADSLLIGSHNYVDTGVYLGTEEIAILTKNYQICTQLKGIVETQIKER